jgi:hypothetical protein
VIETTVVFAGSVSVIVTVPGTLAGPLFVAVMVYLIVLPARTGFGVPVIVTARSACPVVATTTVAIATLFEGFGSVVVAETVAISVIVIPEAVKAFTFTTTVNLVDAPTASVGIVHEITPPVHVQPDVPEVAATETKVVFVGTVSVKATLLAAAGPLFVTTTV